MASNLREVASKIAAWRAAARGTLMIVLTDDCIEHCGWVFFPRI